MPVLSINSDYSNISNFIDSLYDSDVRSLEPIKSAMKSSRFKASFSSEIEKIINLWLTVWKEIQGNTDRSHNSNGCPNSDKNLITFLSNYLKKNRLSMFIPEINNKGFIDEDKPIYELSGYQRKNFLTNDNWNYDCTVRQFLELLIHGAHFVVIHNRKDLPDDSSVSSFWEDFKSDSLIRQQIYRDLPGHSHYTSHININGRYYPSLSITQETAPNPSPLILAFLVGLTVSDIITGSDYETFFQLEGWASPHFRHMVDYDIHQRTLWNISTFGSCAYSEKRGTAIFLAPETFLKVENYKPDPTLIMPPYIGAKTPQHWLRNDLICLSPNFH